MPRTLLCTVGTGTIDDLARTLLDPLKKSIRKGEWDRVVLLPSQQTLENAERLKTEIGDIPIDLKPLPGPKQEDNADACFDHFDRVLSALLAAGHRPDDLLTDFTRGTKAMSAALVLAAVRHGLPSLRYISGGERDERGMVKPGTEIVAEVRTTIATARRRLDDALLFFRSGNFAAVTDLLPETAAANEWPDDLRPTIVVVRQLASCHAAWDRLDYKNAVALANDPSFPEDEALPAGFRPFLPSHEVRTWVSDLAAELPADSKAKAAPLRRLLVDLFANGERRLRDHHYEDALLRAYRVLELLGQVRLFDHGYDSAALPPDDEAILSFQEHLLKKKSEPLTSNQADGKLQAPREKVGRLLKHLGDPLGQELIKAADEGQVKAKTRNVSVLIHGFDAVAGSAPEPLRALNVRLERLIRDDAGQETADRYLRLARYVGVAAAQR